MTPKEKAQELLNKFKHSIRYHMTIDDSRRCSILAVDEIIKSNPTGMVGIPCVDYWEKVKSELEKL